MKDPQHAFLVVLVKQQPREVPNATETHAKRAALKTSTQEHVQSAHKVGSRKSWMPRYARDAHAVSPRPIPVEVLCVLDAILVDLVVGTVFAKHARPDSIKIPKVNRYAVPLASLLEKYPTKNKPGADCHRGALANHKNI